MKNRVKYVYFKW